LAERPAGRGSRTETAGNEGMTAWESFTLAGGAVRKQDDAKVTVKIKMAIICPEVLTGYLPVTGT
jgi:hypothetical protein